MKKKVFKFIVDLLLMAVGSFLYALSITVIIDANMLSAGGVTGISTLVHRFTGIPTGFLVFVINIPIIILGFVKLGKRFIVKTAIATAMVSLSLEITENYLPTYETDNILAAIFGGMVMGLGLSFVFMRGGTTGGVDIIAKVINRRFRHLTVGRVLLVMDGAVILITAIVFRNIETALYSVIAMFVSSKVMDTVLYGSDRGKIIYIVTDNPEEISKAIIERVARGVTMLKAKGAYTGNEKEMLMCTVRLNEVSAVYSVVNEFDKHAFVVVGEAGEIMGEGFKRINS
ncbi:MAG: YitT family protein [Clostridia bacterium]|nr:YitT family protein [Clostridia bacterium]